MPNIRGNLYFPWFCLESRCTYALPTSHSVYSANQPWLKTQPVQNNFCQPAIFNISCGFSRTASHWLTGHATLQKAQEASVCLRALIIRKCSTRLQLQGPPQSVIKDSFCLVVPLKWLPCGVCLPLLDGWRGRHSLLLPARKCSRQIVNLRISFL